MSSNGQNNRVVGQLRDQAITEIKYQIAPATTRNHHNMGLTQPHFPKVVDQLGENGDEGAITHREDEENGLSYAEGMSMLD